LNFIWSTEADVILVLMWAAVRTTARGWQLCPGLVLSPWWHTPYSRECSCTLPRAPGFACGDQLCPTWRRGDHPHHTSTPVRHNVCQTPL